MGIFEKLFSSTEENDQFFSLEISNKFSKLFNEIDEKIVNDIFKLTQELSIISQKNIPEKFKAILNKEKPILIQSKDSFINRIACDLRDSYELGNSILNENKNLLDFYFGVIFDKKSSPKLMAILQVFNPVHKNSGRLILGSFLIRTGEDSLEYWDDIS